MGVKRIHLQLAGKRRWQSEFVESEEHTTEGYLRFDAQQKRWTAKPATYSKQKDLP